MVVATVNGSGSQTSNMAIMRALFRMGIPVSGKNLFPSNIQGLPTWFTIRANADGILARQEQAEILVAMNPATFLEDVGQLPAGGVCFYADHFTEGLDRSDIIYYPMPVQELVREAQPAEGPAGLHRQHGLRRRGRRAAGDRDSSHCARP